MRDGPSRSSLAKTGAEIEPEFITLRVVYAFLLSEVSETKGVEPGSDGLFLDRMTRIRRRRSIRHGCPELIKPAAQLDDFAQAELRTRPRRWATGAAGRRRSGGHDVPHHVSGEYGLQLPHSPDKPLFFVRAMRHDDHRTFIQTSAKELPRSTSIRTGRRRSNFE